MNDEFLLPQRILAGVFGEDFGTFAPEKSVSAHRTQLQKMIGTSGSENHSLTAPLDKYSKKRIVMRRLK
jgi:hypothetical protein